jgi:hypothetical protein
MFEGRRWRIGMKTRDIAKQRLTCDFFMIQNTEGLRTAILANGI